MTFSIVARCARTGQAGVAVSSSSPAVAARCAHARAGVGAVATQNVTDPRLGPAALDLMALGIPAPDAVQALAAAREGIAYRQILAVDVAGRTGIWSGDRALGVNATARGRDCAAGGNLLAGPGIPAAMIEAFESAEGDLGSRLTDALAAGLAAGGEAGPVRSAGLLVVDAQAWPVADLRVDWEEDDPVARLRDLWLAWAPQMHGYVQRALDPAGAPSFGVPGDE